MRRQQAFDGPNAVKQLIDPMEQDQEAQGQAQYESGEVGLVEQMSRLR